MSFVRCEKCGIPQLPNISPMGGQCLCGLPPRSATPSLSESLYAFAKLHAQQIASAGTAEQIGELIAWIAGVEKEPK